MQRVLVIVAVILLVTASLGVGALTANWPFWRRAWAWHAADGGWPSALPGPRIVARGGGGAPLDFVAAGELAEMAGGARTHLLLRAVHGRAEAWFAPGLDAGHVIDGRGLTALVLVPLFTELARRHPDLLDAPAGAWIDAWRQDQRGALTPRELFALAGDGIATRPGFTPLNPFSAGARLASGPDFPQAARAVFDPREPASKAMESAAAAQLLAAIAAASEGGSFARVFELHLWSKLAASDATLLLDRRRGEAAAHCCLEARAADWLRLGLRLAAGGADGIGPHGRRGYYTEGRALLVAPQESTAVLWVGEGEPPSGLEKLLGNAVLEGGRPPGSP